MLARSPQSVRRAARFRPSILLFPNISPPLPLAILPSIEQTDSAHLGDLAANGGATSVSFLAFRGGDNADGAAGLIFVLYQKIDFEVCKGATFGGSLNIS